MRQLIGSAVVALISAVPGRAQCLEFDDAFGSTGTNGVVYCATTFDDGSGPALFVGGRFTVAGDVSASAIARWDGSTFAPVGGGVSGPLNPLVGPEVRAMAVYDDGSGPALFVGGAFSSAGGGFVNSVARWNGSSWSSLAGGADDIVLALTVFDDGMGAALYAAGDFQQIGSRLANHIAKWDGSSWSAVGGGSNDTVYALAVFDDGGGPELYAGTDGGGGIARWNGTTWTALALTNLNSGARALTVFDDGSGAALYVGGLFTTAGGLSASRIARWNGSSWSSLGSGMSAAVYALSVFDDGSGSALYAGGSFALAGGTGVNYVARWNGASWSDVGGGTNGTVQSFASFDDGSGPELFAGGFFTAAAGIVAPQIAKWNGTDWSRLVARGGGLSSSADALTVFDDGMGPALYAGGAFTSAGETFANGVARWDGSSWSALGSGVSSGGIASVRALAVFDDGGGPALYVAGSFTHAGGVPARSIAKWDGDGWSALGTGMNILDVRALIAFDDGSGSALYAGGSFTGAGGASANRIAKWNGSSWSGVGSGMGAAVNALAVFDDGGGLALYAGGEFTVAGGQAANHVAKWNGSSWSVLGSGVAGGSNAAVHSMTVFDDGAGSALVVGGDFVTAGGVAASFIAKWNGTSWTALGAGTNSLVYALTVFDGGAGAALYAGGQFNLAGGTSIKRVAKWDGAHWSSLGGGLDAIVRSLAVFDDGDDGAPDLYVGGGFGLADGVPSVCIAEWRGCPPGNAYCFGDGLDTVVTASCPCGNFGDPGHGCANSNASLGGARLVASGTTNPNTVVLSCTGIVNNNLCTFFRGANHDPQAAVFGDGIKCINPPIFRFGQQNSGQGGNPPFTVAVPAPTQLPGSTIHYAVHYRNPTAGFCDPGLFNASNGYTIAW